MLHEKEKEQKESIARILWPVGAKNMNSLMNSILKGWPKHKESMLQLRPWVPYMISCRLSKGIIQKNFCRKGDIELLSLDIE